MPAKSTIHAVLDRHGLVRRGGGPRHRARGTPLSQVAVPNELWCADFKGEFKLELPPQRRRKALSGVNGAAVRKA